MSPELIEWQLVHGVSDAAMLDLRHRLVRTQAFEGSAERPRPRSEAAVQERERLDTARDPNVILWRNNVGACQTDDGRLIRYGLANDSKRVNKVIKSADLIGIWRYVVQARDVGRTLGLFVSDEVKAEDWTPTSADKRLQAQTNWAALVASYGGVSLIHNGAPGCGLLDKLKTWMF